MSRNSNQQHTITRKNIFPHKRKDALDPFDENYTVSGIIRHVEESLGHLISMKDQVQQYKSHQNRKEIEVLHSVKDNIDILKTILIANINDLFTNIYESGKNKAAKDSTGPNSKNKSNKNQQQSQGVKNQTAISDFNLESDQKNCDQINSLEVTQNNISHYHSKYPQQQIEHAKNNRFVEESKQQKFKITPFFVHGGQKESEIRIQQDEDGFNDLICHQIDIQSMNKRKKSLQKQNNIQFTPIIEKEVQQQQSSIKKFNHQQKKKLQYLQNQIYLKMKRRENKGSLCISQQRPLPKKIVYKKFNYLYQAENL